MALSEERDERYKIYVIPPTQWVGTGLLIFFLIGLPSTAAACSLCVFSSFEYALPYTNLWCLGITFWFCAVKISIRRSLGAVLWSFLAFIAAGAFIGPWAFVLLGGMAFGITVNSYSPDVRKKLSKGSRIALLVVTTVAFTSIPLGLLISIQTRATRDDVQFILKQDGRGAGRIALQHLLSDPKKNERQLREIIIQIQNEFRAEEIRQALTKLAQEKQAAPVATEQ